MRVIPVPALGDNYAYVVEGEGGEALVVDPGEAAPVIGELDRLGLRCAAMLVTHHHHDHSGGAAAVSSRFSAPVIATPGTWSFAGVTIEAAPTPGHTLDHLAFLADGTDLFTGDLLFGLTIGNLFEGTPDVMWASLRRVASLPPSTRLWPGHEYTRMAIDEALRVDPGNEALAARAAALRASEGPTVPLTLAEELATNPFLRCADADAFRRLCEET